VIRISLDIMGGDHAPEEIFQGAYLALKEYEFHILLVGPEEITQKQLLAFPDWPMTRTTIVHAPEVVGMSESPSLAFRKKKNSSIQIGLNLVKDHQAEAFVSAGNTGAVMTASVLTLGRIPGVERPAIGTLMPSKHGYCLMLDMGSTVDCKAAHLAQFAIMGHFLAQSLLKIESPRIALLNIGEEEDKGNQVTLEAYALLKSNSDLNFIGNVEGKDILYGKADVVVCDGFVGNTVLKFGEGVTAIFMDFFKSEAKSSVLSLLGALLLKPALKRFLKTYDYQEVGGAPLLGVNGVSIIAHGKSSRIAIKNAIRSAVQTVSVDVVGSIKKALEAR